MAARLSQAIGQTVAFEKAIPQCSSTSHRNRAPDTNPSLGFAIAHIPLEGRGHSTTMRAKVLDRALATELRTRLVIVGAAIRIEAVSSLVIDVNLHVGMR